MASNIIRFPAPKANFDAAIDDDTMEQMEMAATSPARGQQRRCALVALARNRATLTNLAETSPDAFEDFAGAVRAFKVQAVAQLELAEAAAARVELVAMGASHA